MKGKKLNAMYACSPTKMQRLWSDIRSLFQATHSINKLNVVKRHDEFEPDYPLILVYLSSNLEQIL